MVFLHELSFEQQRKALALAQAWPFVVAKEHGRGMSVAAASGPDALVYLLARGWQEVEVEIPDKPDADAGEE